MTVQLKKHQKHTNLIKPTKGKYHRNEIGLVGAPCGTIQKLALAIKDKVGGQYQLGYMDAEHGEGAGSTDYDLEYVDKISHHQISFKDENPDYSLYPHFAKADALLINANHFRASANIVIINAEKEGSLKRKLDRLNDVKAFVLDHGVDAPFDFLQESIVDYKSIPIVRISEVETLANIIVADVTENIPPITGLILYGGKSTRMGRDKGLIQYHGMPQHEYVANQLSPLCDEVLISIAEKKDVNTSLELVEDSFVGLGPFGGILTAFRRNPNRAYLSIPCDVPLVDTSILAKLIENRNPSKVATCFHNSETKFPEPLITIWEPKAYSKMLFFLSLGYSCPRKVLINSDVIQVKLEDESVLMNANTPIESKLAKQRLY